MKSIEFYYYICDRCGRDGLLGVETYTEGSLDFCQDCWLDPDNPAGAFAAKLHKQLDREFGIIRQEVKA